MTKAEFIQRSRAQQRHFTKVVILWFIAVFAVLGADGIFAGFIDNQPKSAKALYKIGFGVILLGQFAGLIWLGHRDIRKHGLVCPSCKKSLTGPLAQIAIAAGHCGFCGAKLFSDLPESSKMDQTEFQTISNPSKG